VLADIIVQYPDDTVTFDSSIGIASPIRGNLVILSRFCRNVGATKRPSSDRYAFAL
jgi:hypothetical protein